MPPVFINTIVFIYRSYADLSKSIFLLKTLELILSEIFNQEDNNNPSFNFI